MPLQSVDLHGKGGSEAFQPTPDEVRTIQEKMKDPEFMKLMSEYMESLQDPEYRKEEEEYLNQIEQEARTQGDYSFDFIFPKEVFYIELLNVGNGKRVFVNICSCEKVEPYTEQTTGDKMGSNWNVPVSVGREREDLINEQDAGGKSGEKCITFDAVFNPSTVALSERSDRFQTFLVEIAVENINGGYGKQFGYEYRRCCNSSSVRKCVGAPANQTIKKEGTSGKLPVAGPVSTSPHNFKAEAIAAAAAASASKAKPDVPPQGPILPSYTIAHRGTIDMSDAWNWKSSDKRIGVPKELVVKLDFSAASNKVVGFQGVKQASWLDLDVSTSGTVLELHPDEEESRHPFGGHIILPFTVEADPSSAKFDRQKSILTLVLVVIPSEQVSEASNKAGPVVEEVVQSEDPQVEQASSPTTQRSEAVEAVGKVDEPAVDMMEEARKEVQRAREEREKQEQKRAKEEKVTKAAISPTDQSPLPPTPSHEVDSEERPEIVDLRNKQRDWLNAEKARAEKQEKSIHDAINELSKIVDDDEDEIALKREQEAKSKKALRDQQRKELAEKESERLEMMMREKMAELPLKSALIFEIE